MPFTSVCVDCKSKFEREALLSGGRLDETRGMIDKAEAEEEEF